MIVEDDRERACPTNTKQLKRHANLLEPLLAQLVGHLDSILVLLEVAVVAVEGEADLLKQLDRGRVVLLDLHEELLQLRIAYCPHHHQNHGVVAVPLATVGLVRDHHVELSHVPYAETIETSLRSSSSTRSMNREQSPIYSTPSPAEETRTVVSVLVLHGDQEGDLYG